MATLFLIRHAEPELRGIFLGRLDCPLSADGHAQARAALQHIEPVIAYTSPSLRARQTAAYLRAPKLLHTPDLLEQDQGEWTGLTWAEIERKWPELAQQRCADWLGTSAPGGETWQQLQARAAALWNRVRKGPEPCAIVAHQAMNAALASVISNIDPLQFNQRYAEVLRLEYT